MNDSSEDGESDGTDVASSPNDAGDPKAIVDKKIPKDIREKYETYSYRNAAVILSETRESEFSEILNALRKFEISVQDIRTAGGNETEIPKKFSDVLRPLGWHETSVSADLMVKLVWREEIGKNPKGKSIRKKQERLLKRERFIDGHKIDYVKEKVAFDLEWNSKDQTFDRDLYAFNAFFMAGAIDAAILVTRSKSLDDVFRSVGPALKKDGITVEMLSDGKPRPTISKFGASTTWMGKLLYRMNAGRNGGCPVLIFGITPKCIKDWP